jgi:flagellar hook-associated protein 1 FlgK
MDTSAHNIANANTPGYHRQEVTLGSRRPFPSLSSLQGPLGGQWGTGVEIVSVRRAQDAYLGLHLRTATGQLAQWQAADSSLEEIQAVLAPGSGSDLGSLLDNFWNAWQTLSTSPEDVAARVEVRSRGLAVADGFRDAVQQLRASAAKLDDAVQAGVDEINQLTGQVASLNRDISVALAAGRSPNDLLDTRDQLLLRLGELTGASPLTSQEGDLILNLGGRPLVQGQLAFQLTTVRGPSGHLDLVWQEDGSPVTLPAGQISGNLQVRDEVIPAHLAQLDQIASNLVSAVNSLHQGGYALDGVTTGLDFFVAGSTAADLALDPALLDDASLIAAAAAPDSPGDGSLALAIAGVRTQGLLPAGETLNQAWQGLLEEVGSQVQAAKDNITTTQLRYDQLLAQQDSLSGVSLDEEIAQMMQFQHAYEAAAKVMSVLDQMLATLIEQVGQAG